MILILGLGAVFAAPAALARVVEAQGSAPIVNGQQGVAREQALRNALRQALLQGSARVDSTSVMADHALVADSMRISSTGTVKDVVVLREWQGSDHVMHVLIRAQVVEAPQGAKPGARYRKKIAAVQFHVRDGRQILDLPGLETALPREILRRMENTGTLLTQDGTTYYISPEARVMYADPARDPREALTRLADSLDAQFLIAGSIHDLGQSRQLFQRFRRIEIDVVIYDGLTGEIISRRRVNDTVKGVGAVPKNIAFGTAEFLRTRFGRAMDGMLDQLASGVQADLARLPFAARVIRSEGERVFINAGVMSQVQVGDVLTAYQLSADPLREPGSKGFRGYPETPVTTLVVKQVQPSFAVAEMASPESGLKPGDIVRFGQ